MTTFVLVHGSFHGGWCWQRVTARLRDAGHTVYAPTMTGLGERSHLVTPQTGLAVNIQDVTQRFGYEELEDVVLVGHSYGSLVVTGVAEHCADRIAHVVHLDGFLPEHGQSAWDVNPDAQARWEVKAAQSGTGWLVPPPDPESAYGIVDPDDLTWVRERLTPTTLWTHEEPLQAPNERIQDLPRTYINCERYEGFQHMAEKARKEELDYYEIDTGHDAMITSPDKFSTILREVAGSVD